MEPEKNNPQISNQEPTTSIGGNRNDNPSLIGYFNKDKTKNKVKSGRFFSKNGNSGKKKNQEYSNFFQNNQNNKSSSKYKKKKKGDSQSNRNLQKKKKNSSSRTNFFSHASKKNNKLKQNPFTNLTSSQKYKKVSGGLKFGTKRGKYPESVEECH